MHLYLYDAFLNDKKYSSTIARVETRLTDLGIGGKICRLSPLRNTQELITDEIRNGVRTIVVVGNDKTVSEVINATIGFAVVIGIIPIGEPNTVARLLGIPNNEAACDTLAARITQRLDLGKINNTYFISSLSIGSGKVTIECEQQFRITSESDQAQVTICNFLPGATVHTGKHFNPQDGLLEVCIQPPHQRGGFFSGAKQTQPTIIPFRQLSIDSRENVSITTDGARVLKTPVVVEVVPKKIRVVVGKQQARQLKK